MAKRIKLPNFIEKNNNLTETNRENLTILEWINKDSFDKLAKWFSSEKEENKIVLSWFLNSTNVTLSQLWNIKIDINHIKNYIQNKPDIPKDLEKKIAKLFLKKLYESWATNIPFMTQIKNAFEIENEADIENKNIDFKKIQIDIQKFWDEWNDKINSVTVSNDEIFDLLGGNINRYANFQSQKPSSQWIILDILQFEMKSMFKKNQLRWESMEKDMEGLVSPINNISDIFNEAIDSEISQLDLQKACIQDILVLDEEEIATKEEDYWEKYINMLEKQWLAEDDINKLKNLLSWKIEYNTLQNNLKKLIETINKQIWKKYIENFEKIWKNPEFIAILKKLQSSNFDFSKLDKKEQTILWQPIILNRFGKKENLWMKYIWLNQEDFKSFLKDLYDFEKDEITIDINGVWSLKLHITKELQWWENKEFLDIDSFKNMDARNPVKFTVNLDGNDKKLIKDVEETEDSPLRADWIMETHTTKRWKLNIWNWYKLEICGKIITKSQLDELLDCDYDEDKLNQKLKDFGLYDKLKDQVISVKKKMFNPENVYYDFDENWVAQNNDKWYWPYGYKFCIFEEMLKNLDVKVVERNIIFEWKNVDKLSQIYIMSKLSWNKTKENQDKKVNELLDAAYHPEEWLWWKEEWEKYAEEIFKKIMLDVEDYNWESEESSNSIISQDTETSIMDYWNHLNEEGKQSFKEKLYDLIDNDDKIDNYVSKEDIKDEIDDMLRIPNGNTETDQSELEEKLGIKESTDVEQSEEEKFQEAREKISWDKECPFAVWTKLYFDLWESQIPPKDRPSYYCFDIVDVGETNFTIRAVWWELKSGLVDNTYTFNKTADSLEKLTEWKPTFKVWPGDWKDRNSCINNISKSWFFDSLNVFWASKDKIQLKWDKFVQTINEDWKEKEVEIKYFNRIDKWFDDDAGKQWDKLYEYEIKKIDTSKWTVKIASNFEDYNEDWESVTYAYENELPFEQFILLVEWKGLIWASKEKQDWLKKTLKINDPWRLANKWNRKWISIWAIINVVKNWKKAFDAKLAEYRKEQEDALDNYLYSHEWLNVWGKIWWFASMMWLRSVSNACNELYYDFYTNRENRTWKKIEKRCKVFEAEPNYSECYKEVLLPILKEPWCKMYADDDTRYRFAAAFLLMLKNEWPYPRDFWWDLWKWVWVEKFLWSSHAEKFRKFYNEKKIEIEQAKNQWYSSDAILARQEELNKMEVTYIISIIDGLAPYNDNNINEFEAKSIWWLKFKDKLSENFSWYFDKHNESKNKMSTFFAAEEQYLRTIWAGRFNKALPALERMCEKAETPQEAFRTKWYLLSAMLMWVIKNNSSASTIKSFFNTCRSMWFAPWSWMKDMDQQRKVQILLDWVTNWEFSKDPKLQYSIFDFEPWHIKDGKYWFVKKFESYWNANWHKILKKIEKPSYKSGIGDKSIMEMAADENNPDRSVFVEYVSNTNTVDYDPPNWEVSAVREKTAPWTAISNKVRKYIPSKWGYSNLTKEEDKKDAEEFWTNAAKEIPTGEVGKIEVEDTFTKFFKWFDSKISSVNKPIVKSLKLIQQLKKEWKYREVEFMLSYLIRWNMHRQTGWIFPKEFEVVIENFRKFFINNIQSIDDGVIERAFENDHNLVNAYREGENMIMFNRYEYKRYKMNNYKGNGGWWSEKSKYSDLMQYELRKLNYENRNKNNYYELTFENDVINSEIESIWRSCNNCGASRAPNVNMSFSSEGIRLHPENYTKDDIRNLNNWLTELEDKAA